ncbi:hypothetical protein FB45DRAFT_868996 [Roridomyces roridus]|uniref:Uncharacterized protein n=1 Tax=Roridomyces roridus TaxID=1738132 RepID=A0AAD7FKZ3_9AGAR|nr:hypothetical protein FB45DRAFT_868996 [Roridomyces roridus]
MKFTAVFASLLVAALSAAAASLDVFDPPVTSPTAGTDSDCHLRLICAHRDTSNPPAEITDTVGMLVLVKDKVITPVILAENFSILLGHIEVTVPLVFEGSYYQLDLFGDSGNLSPEFTIQGSGISF